MKQIEEIFSNAMNKVREMEGNPSDLRISSITIFPQPWGSTALGFSGMMGKGCSPDESLRLKSVSLNIIPYLYLSLKSMPC